MLWYVSQDRKTEGPLNEQRLAMLIHWGKITRRAYVCDEQLSSWVSIERTAFAPLLAQQPEEPQPAAPGVLRGGPLRFSTRALQRLGAVLAAVSMLAGALALMEGLASSRRMAREVANAAPVEVVPAPVEVVPAPFSASGSVID
ncbi:MAG: hypothetical protein RL685_4164 [Pseudomonadota bacterium]|jgi:hypothetical protein